ncbi:MAG TPA: LysR family transcriptional regulator [Candidatus Acidoferrales bacterium]|jgi:DNA-binding transcriptional LysR family regulator|nr:LysR family transcriptional regulator [Candidatus Acidoferrales bacterium]
MNLKELRSLVALVELGSITATAEKLYLSPAAIHKQLKVLEDELGVRLYEKIGRRLQLTQPTEILLPYLKEVLAQHDAAIAALAEWKGMKRGLIRIGAGPAMSSYIVPPLLKQFRRAFPDVDLFVQSGNTPSLLESLGHGSIDLALLISPDLTEGPAFQVDAHWDFEMLLVSHMRHVPRRCELGELGRYPFILYQKGSRMEKSVDRYFAANDFSPRVIMRFDNAEAIKAMTQAGLGISMLPLWIIDAELKSGRLAAIRQKEPPLFSKIALLSRKSSYVAQAVQAFIDQTRKFEWNRPRLATESKSLQRHRERGKGN